MKKIVYTFLFLALTANLSNAQTLVSAQLLASKTVNQIKAVIGAAGMPYNTVKLYKVRYNTTDPFGNPTVASGAIFIPGIVCDSIPLVGYCHGTVLRKTQVPSAQYDSNYEGLFFSAKGYAVAMPDYLGLGEHAGFHPYLHAETEATATIDLMRALREFVNDSTTLGLNGQVFITGYSQGGHAAMATLKYIKDHNLTSEFNVVAGGPMSGPYSLSTVQPRTIYDSVYAYNGFSPYVINSYQYVYGNLYTNVSEYYDAPYDTSIPPYMNGSSTFGALNVALPTNIYHFMNDSILDAFIADTITFSTPLRHDLKLNDNYAWDAGNTPLRLCYCGSDDLVLPGNSLTASDSMAAMGSTNVVAVNINPAGDHFTCFTPAITYVRNFFDSLRVICTAPTSIAELSVKNNTIQLFPNPASDNIIVQSANHLKEIYVIDINGKEVFKAENLNQTTLQITTTNFNNGFYFIKSVDHNGSSNYSKIIVQKGS